MRAVHDRDSVGIEDRVHIMVDMSDDTKIVRRQAEVTGVVYEALREVAFEERAKINDLVLEGIELALRKRGYPSIADLKAKYERKGR